MKLFGGAVETSLPQEQDLLSASEVRQVPNNQEVFVHRTHANTSLIIEMVEPLDAAFVPTAAGDTEAAGLARGEPSGFAVTHFEEIAMANDAQSYEVHPSYKLHRTIKMMDSNYSFPVEACRGVQHVFKFNASSEEELDAVRIWVGVIRMRAFEVDIVLSVNCADVGVEETYLQELFEAALMSLRVTDFKLFINESEEMASSSDGGSPR